MPRKAAALPAMPANAKVVKGDLVVRKSWSFQGAVYVQGNVRVSGVLEETAHTDCLIATGSITARAVKCGGTIYAGKKLAADVVFVELEGRLGAVGRIETKLAILEDPDCDVEGSLAAEQKVVLSLGDPRPLKRLSTLLAPAAFGLVGGQTDVDEDSVFDYSNLMRTMARGKPWQAPRGAKPTKLAKAKPKARKTDSSHFTRRFVFAQGSSSKYWELELDGETMITRWGRVGTTGQSKTKKFSGWANSTYAADQLIRAKKAEGYKEAR